MKKFVMLVGPPGSGKSTFAQKYIAEGFEYINQDSQGPNQHILNFLNVLKDDKNVIVDRMNFDTQQRDRYLSVAKKAGYHTTIIVLHESYKTCVERAIARTDHPTIKNDKQARSAINFFFSKYVRVQDSEADDVIRVWPGGDKPRVIVCDLDGTLCNVEHRRHHVRPPEGTLVGPNNEMVQIFGQYDAVPLDKPLPKFKKNWAAFFADIPKDTVNEWCASLLRNMACEYKIIYCSGRDDNQRKATIEWLEKHKLDSFFDPLFETNTKADLYMRNRQDSRQDSIVKEIILDFEILTRYKPCFMIDDRQQVVDMWRKRGFTCLQCDVGDF